MPIDISLARKQFLAQKAGAKNRGVEWALTFDQWLKIWVDSGKYAARGVGADKYCMTRVGDCGPYAAWNVRIRTQRENLSESNIGMRNGEHRLDHRPCNVNRKLRGTTSGEIDGWSPRYGEDPLEILMREEA